MTAGLLNKAARGDLALTLPTGFERDPLGRVHKDPHLAVQARITLVFETFMQRRSASKVLEFFHASGLRLPRRDRFGDVVWKRPTIAAILAILKHPAVYLHPADNYHRLTCRPSQEQKGLAERFSWPPSGSLTLGDALDAGRADARRQLRPPHRAAARPPACSHPHGLGPRRHTAQEHLPEGPDMVGQARRHGWRTGPPLPGRTAAVGGLGLWQRQA